MILEKTTFKYTQEELKNKAVPEILLLTKRVRVMEHKAVRAVGHGEGTKVFVSGDHKLDLLASGIGVRIPKEDKKKDAELNSVNPDTIIPEPQKKKLFGRAIK